MLVPAGDPEALGQRGGGARERPGAVRAPAASRRRMGGVLLMGRHRRRAPGLRSAGEPVRGAAERLRRRLREPGRTSRRLDGAPVDERAARVAPRPVRAALAPRGWLRAAPGRGRLRGARRSSRRSRCRHGSAATRGSQAATWCRRWRRAPTTGLTGTGSTPVPGRPATRSSPCRTSRGSACSRGSA